MALTRAQQGRCAKELAQVAASKHSKRLIVFILAVFVLLEHYFIFFTFSKAAKASTILMPPSCRAVATSSRFTLAAVSLG